MVRREELFEQCRREIVKAIEADVVKSGEVVANGPEPIQAWFHESTWW